MYLTRKQYGKVTAVFTYVHMFTYMKDRGWCLVSPSNTGSCILHFESTPVTGLDHTSLATVMARKTQASSSFCLASSGITEQAVRAGLVVGHGYRNQGFRLELVQKALCWADAPVSFTRCCFTSHAQNSPLALQHEFMNGSMRPERGNMDRLIEK